MQTAQLFQETVESKEKEFYDKKFYFSYSSLNKLIWSPQVFYQMYVLGLKEEKTDAHLIQGKLIHLLLLEPENFEKQFILSPSSLPSGNLKTVVDTVFKQHLLEQADTDLFVAKELADYTDLILEVMRNINYHQSLKTDQQRLDKILCPEALNYWTFLNKKGTRSLVDADTFKFCSDAVELIKTNQQVLDLLGFKTTEFDNKEVMNEVLMNVDLPNKPFGLKGIIDNIVINHDKKVIYINDVKTSSKDLKDFPESIEYYAYWMQCIIYMMMVGTHYRHLVDQGYDVNFHFIVIDRTFQTYAFPVSQATANIWLDKFKEIVDVAEWHYVHRNYELPYAFAKGTVVL